MAVKPFSVVGDALQFSVRRFETVLRVSFLPIVLLLITNMTATFGYLSVANERLITFKDVVAARVPWARASQIGAEAAQSGLAEGSTEVWAIYLATNFITAILIASFMAPLIRYAGLGVKPAPGWIRIPFGADQFRFLLGGVLSALIFLLIVYAPISLATFSVAAFISQAMTTPYAKFPDSESLHTIDVITGADAFGVRWLHEYQVWGVAALAASAVLIALLIMHFRPHREDRSAGIGLLGRTLGVTTGVAFFLALSLTVYMIGVKLFGKLITAAGGVAPTLSLDDYALALFIAAIIAFAGFFSLRLFPYAGIAVCRRSMSFKNVFRTTRRYDVLRVALAFVILGIVLFLTQILLLWIGLASMLSVLNAIYNAVASVVRLLNAGGGDEWVLPFFRWVWAMIGVTFTVLWAAFTYGVNAGLWGRLYRDTENS